VGPVSYFSIGTHERQLCQLQIIITKCLLGNAPLQLKSQFSSALFAAL
jgi:hypothetical protein